MSMKDCIVVDIDETIIDTNLRKQAVFKLLLKKDIPISEITKKGSWDIIKNHLGDQCCRETWIKFWKIILCVESNGLNFLHLDRPIPQASQVLSEWAKKYAIVYLTNRTENMRGLTIKELRKLGFPIKNSNLFMAKDFEEVMNSPVESRKEAFSRIIEKYDVIAVIDDYPRFFPIYKSFAVPERIGLLKFPRFREEDYIKKGANLVVKDWGELTNKF